MILQRYEIILKYPKMRGCFCIILDRQSENATVPQNNIITIRSCSVIVEYYLNYYIYYNIYNNLA